MEYTQDMIDTLFRLSPPIIKEPLARGYNLTRSALYLLESLPLLVLNQGLSKDQFKAFPPEVQKQIVEKLWEFLKEDSARFAKGVYPADLLKAESGPISHGLEYIEVLVDALSVLRRKQHQVTKEFSNLSEQQLNELPEYYRRNFHHQTDGYLSDKSARLYDHQVEILFRGTAAAMRRRFLEPLKKEISGQGQGLHILDVACGTGDSTRVLQAAYPQARIEGLDLSDAYLLQARQRMKTHNRVHFIQGEAEDLPFKDERFDLLLSIYLFHEIPFKIRKQVVREALRTLKPGAYFVLVDSLQLHDDSDLEWPLKRFPVDFHEPFYKHYIENPLEELVEKEGFDIVATDIGFFTKSLILQKPVS